MRFLRRLFGGPIADITRRPSRPSAAVAALVDGGTMDYRRELSDRPTLARVCHVEPWTQILSWQSVEEPLLLPTASTGAFRATRATSASEAEQERCARWAAAEVARMAPWVRLYVGPQLEGRWSQGRDEALPLWGWALCGPEGQGDTVLLRSDMREDQVRATLWHELWHILERALTESAMATVNEALRRPGGAWGGASKLMSDPKRVIPTDPGYGWELLGSDVERRARLFELWCSLIDEGGAAVIPATASSPRFRDWREVFEAARTGGMARHLVETGLVRRP